jgi:hypothetical protein
MNNQKILDIVMENVWLLDNVFWENTGKIIFDRDREYYKNQLKYVYHYKDVDLFFPSEVDNSRLFEVMSTMFRFANGSTPQQIDNNWNIIK